MLPLLLSLTLTAPLQVAVSTIAAKGIEDAAAERVQAALVEEMQKRHSLHVADDAAIAQWLGAEQTVRFHACAHPRCLTR